MIYKDYLEAIQKHYKHKKKENELSQLLLNPTPGNLRDECVRIYKLRFARKDLSTLHAFFDTNDDSNVLKAIERFDITRFKPLSNFLKKGGTGGTETKNIELLGWLLDFQPRPYDDHFDYTAATVLKATEEPVGENEGSKSEVEPEGGADDIDDNGFADTPVKTRPSGRETGDKKQNGSVKKLRSIVGVVIIASGLIAVVFLGIKDSSGCMIWINDHYEPISCDSSGNGKLIVARNENVLRYMKRITKPDTLTAKDIRNVWYRKRKVDSLDYFTMGGRDPIDPVMDLKRMSPYIFEKHLLKKDLADSTQLR